MRLYAQEGFLEVATTVEPNPKGLAGVSNKRVRDLPSAPRPMQNKEAPPALECGRGGAARVGRSVAAKSRRGFSACLYSKSNWEGFEGVWRRVLETPLAAREEWVGGGQEAITESSPTERD